LSSKVYGLILVLVAIALITIYTIGLIIAPDMTVYGNLTFSQALIHYTIYVFILLISIILGYIGYLLLTSPVPKPVEEIVKEFKEQT